MCNYTGLSPVEAGWALDALYRKEYLKVVSTKCECDTNDHGEVINVEVFTLCELTPAGKKAAQKIPLHMNWDNGQTVLNGRWSGSNSRRKENDYETD